MRLRSSLLATLLLAGGLFVAAPMPAVCAAEGSAVLVVATGGTTYRYCVALPETSVSGLDLIRLAGDQHGLQYSLGYGGRAVCQLAGVGPEGDDCFSDHPNFWGFWRGDGSGGWTWSGTGAGSTTVRSGEVQGWAWGSGQDGSSHPQPPATTYGSVCSAPAGSGGAGSSDSSGSGKPKSKTTPPPGTTEGTSESDSVGDLTEGTAEADDGAETTPKKKKPKKDDSPDVEPAEDEEMDNSDDDVEPGGETSLAAEEGPPAAGLLGLGLAVLFGVFGAMFAARRQKRRG